MQQMKREVHEITTKNKHRHTNTNVKSFIMNQLHCATLLKRWSFRSEVWNSRIDPMPESQR